MVVAKRRRKLSQPDWGQAEMEEMLEVSEKLRRRYGKQAIVDINKLVKLISKEIQK